MISVFEEIADDFEDLIHHKGLILDIEKKNESLHVSMNKDLAYILANNLIKNAVSHNIKNGNISIVFDAGAVIIANDGIPVNDDIFKRYISSSTDAKSTGLGLSIAKSIADIYNFRITHRYQDKHIFTIKFPESATLT